jgi:hypothetical protein
VGGARVVAYWLEGVMRTDAMLKAEPHERTTTADADGRYVFCDLPDSHRFLLSATVGMDRRTPPAPSIQPTSDRIRKIDLLVRPMRLDPTRGAH